MCNLRLYKIKNNVDYLKSDLEFCLNITTQGVPVTMLAEINQLKISDSYRDCRYNILDIISIYEGLTSNYFLDRSLRLDKMLEIKNLANLFHNSIYGFIDKCKTYLQKDYFIQTVSKDKAAELLQNVEYTLKSIEKSIVFLKAAIESEAIILEKSINKEYLITNKELQQ